jgi:nucleoside-diphosphate-sugar epimerase
MTQKRTKDALVAGGLGVIGRNLVEHLAARAGLAGDGDIAARARGVPSAT